MRPPSIPIAALRPTPSPSRIATAARVFVAQVLLACVAGCQPARDDLDGQVASWVLAQGGRVTVEANAHKYELEPKHRLPAGDFRVTRISWDVYPGDENTAVTDADLARFVELQQLRELDLWTAPITDAGLVHVGKIASLERLQLSQTPITDAGLLHLAGLTRLKQVTLVGTQVTASGLTAFRRKHPGCEVLTGQGSKG
jgi:hypothetical protein